MNEVILILEIIIVFSMLLLTKKYFGKYGIIGWVGVASIIANIQVTKNINTLGLGVTVGNVLFASNYLATDILIENYGKKYGKIAVHFGLFSTILYLIFTQILLLYIPNEIDIMHESLKTVFGIAPRVCIASIVTYYISNLADVYIYDKLKTIFKSKKMWIRNNVSTIICNCIENFLFFTIAYLGMMDIKEIIVISITSSIIEIIIALCDTPFLYISRKIKDKV